MKLFHRGISPLSATHKAAPATAISADVAADENSAEAAAPTAIIQEKFPAISMSADLKGMLDQPLDPRVDRILQKINDDKVAEERSAKARRIIRFPRDEKQSRVVSESDADISVADQL